MALLLVIGVCRAGELPATDWSAVRRLPIGTGVDVRPKGAGSAQGKVMDVTPFEVKIDTAGGVKTFACKDVERIHLNGVSRKKRTLIGMAMGAGLGAAIMAIAAQAGDVDVRYDYLIGGGAALGAGIGAGIGAASGAPRTIYRASQSKGVSTCPTSSQP